MLAAATLLGLAALVASVIPAWRAAGIVTNGGNSVD